MHQTLQTPHTLKQKRSKQPKFLHFLQSETSLKFLDLPYQLSYCQLEMVY